ncbi:unnamed protein product [Menidia menidia]|uniref:(Atlantic silverside) hypothetical protein n=1 Tax=Menidia menidia TaxID=238744 RepID=A0A8S4BGS8_9TELE|nr:unnamed protein product [Menidia menidia]
MDRDRGFNFKLLVPPRVKTGQINAVRPQEILDNNDDFLNALQQGFNKCDKELNMPSSNTSVITSSKPTRQDFVKMTIVAPMEKDENNCNTGELYSKLFNEFERIKCWKVKMDSDIVQKERRLQDNIRTIETQRKAIQELQFGNESLSIKLEEQISENEDLRNKNNATRSLCNILKETFQWSAEKMHLFESEREETHQVFMENSDSVKKMVEAFENLRIRVEADQQEMQRNQQLDLLKKFENEKESLLQKLQTAEQCCKEAEKKEETTAAALEQSRKDYEQIILNKDLSVQELITVKSQQTEKLEKLQTTIEELKNSLALETERSKDLQEELIENNIELQMRTTSLEEATEQSAKKDDLIKTLKEEQGRVEELVAELSKKTEEMQMFQTKMDELEGKLADEMKKNKDSTLQMEQLKQDIMLQEGKYEELLSNFNNLETEKMIIQKEFEKGFTNVKATEAVRKASEEKTVKLKKEIQTLERENQCLRNEVDTIRNRVQGKCQETETLQKKIEENCERLQEEITVKEKQIKAMESKNKILKKQIEKETAKSSQLETKVERLQEESQQLKSLSNEEKKMLKDLESKTAFATELENEVQKLKLTAAEAVKSKEDTELKCQHKIADMVALMEKHKSQYDRMVEEKDAELDENKKKKMEAVAHAKSLENLSRELTDLKQEMSSVKIRNSQPIPSEEMKTPGGYSNSISGASKIKSYRIRTPPSDTKASRWGKTTIELDPKSDSSDQIDLLTFAGIQAQSGSVPKCRVNIFKKSPLTLKSPGNSLKLAAIKRMRDAGWTAVTSCDKKKKKTNEKVFA